MMKDSVITAVKKAGKRYRVYLDDKPVFSVSAAEAADLDLHEGDILSAERYMQISEKILKRDAVEKSLGMLERGDRTCSQIRQSLTRLSFPAEVIEETVQKLIRAGYLDDLRFSIHYVETHTRKDSAAMIRQQLRMKGVPQDTVREALSQAFEADEKEQILFWMNKKRFDPETADQKEKERMIRVLSSRGYSWSGIGSCLNDIDISL